MYNNEASKRSEPFFLGFPRKKTGENDSTGYTLVEPRHIRVPFVYKHYTHSAD